MVWQTRVTSPAGKLLALVTQTQIVLEPARPQDAAHTPQQAIAALFEGKSLPEQKALLASLEHGGAALYRQFAEQENDPAARAELLRAAEREEENARTLGG
jgi:hypothetical protein